MAAGRLQRWSVFLSNFDFDIQHISGKSNVNADFLSRFPLRQEDEEADVSYLNFLSGNIDEMIAKHDIQRESSTDSEISKVICALRNGWTDEMKKIPQFKPFIQRAEELTIEDNILMWGYRVVVPLKLRSVLVNALHTSHSGMVKMKARARSIFWWPSMDGEIENVSRACTQCLENAPEQSKSSLISWPSTLRPFERVHIDFLGPIQGKMFLILVDSFSKWVEVFQMANTTATTTVEKLRECFARFGLPDTIVSDNGPQFTSSDYKIFCKRNGINCMFSPPYKPQCNGAAENSVKSFKSALKKMLEDPSNQSLNLLTLVSRYLFFYRSSIHCSTGETPYKLLFGREMVTHFDRLKPNLFDKIQLKIEDKNGKQEKTIKQFNEGDRVLVRSFGRNDRKWESATVKNKEGNKIYVCKTVDGRLKRLHVDQMVKDRKKMDEQIYDLDDLQNLPVINGVNEIPNIHREIDNAENEAEQLPRLWINEGASGDGITSRFGRVIRPPERYVPT